jgi:hypothetical protein
MDPVTVVQGQVEAFNARDLERYVSYYSADAVLEDGNGQVMAQGHDAIRALYGQLFSQSPALHADIPQRIQVGSYVIDEEQISGFIFEGFPSEMHSAVIYRVEDETIAHARILF